MNKYYLCKTQEEYDWLMKKLEKEGYRWNSGDKLSSVNNFTPKHYTLIECWSDSTILYENFSIDFIECRKDEIKGATQVSELMKEEEEKQSRQVVYLVQKILRINKSVKTADGVFRTFQAAEKHILDQGGRPLGFFCYESAELGFEIEQFELLEVRE